MQEPHCAKKSDIVNLEKHWNDTYLKTPTDSLGWYEEHATPSLELIALCELEKDDLIVHAGAGASTLIESLLEEGFTNIAINDIAAAPLLEMQHDLSDWTHVDLDFIVDDLTRPTSLKKLKHVALWHDRAVLHFFTEKEQQDTYFGLIQDTVKPGGFVILAEFSLKGANKCSGLPVINYSTDMLIDRMGPDFKVIKSFDYLYTQPSGGSRPFIYTLFQRIQ